MQKRCHKGAGTRMHKCIVGSSVHELKFEYSETIKKLEFFFSPEQLHLVKIILISWSVKFLFCFLDNYSKEPEN